MLKERSQVNIEDTWDLTPMYPSKEVWRKEYEVFSLSGETKFNDIQSFRGKLGQGANFFFECLIKIFDTDRKLSQLYTYAQLYHHQDVAADEAKQMLGSISHLYYEFQEAFSWFDSELLALSDEKLKQILQEPKAFEYLTYLHRVIRLKPHTLSEKEEELLSYGSKVASGPYKIFSAINNADIKFEKIKDSEGKFHEVSHGTYHLFLESKDRELRKNAFESIHEGFKKLENSIAEMLQAHVATHVFNAKCRKYNTCLDAALFPHEIDTKVYFNLIETVKSRIDVMHRYVKFRKEFLSLKKVHAYDMYLPCIDEISFKFTYDEAVEIIIEAVAVLGKEYQNILKEGLLSKRWVDRYENLNKRSGAYSSGCYDSYPYILMNFHGSLSDLLTLAHEAGHSMHSYLSSKHQPYQYSSYTIFVAEVASTFNEELVYRHLLSKVKSDQERKFILNKRIDGIRGTLFRQTLFAEFELKIHQKVEKGEPLTPKILKEIYQELNQEYYGSDFCSSDQIVYECLRIPHFYSNFYVYQYATGISAALALVEKVTQSNDAKSYLEFLSSGSKDHSLNLLKKAGVDMTTSTPVHVLINQFEHLLSEIQS